MTRRERLERKYNSLVYNHLWLKYLIEYGVAVIATLFSAAIFAFGVNVFLEPGLLGGDASGITTMVSGGSSGAAQVFNLLFEINGVTIKNNPHLIFTLFYLLVNLPLIVLAYKGIGKRFGTLTLLNVGTVFILSNLMHGGFFRDLAVYINTNSGMLGRALFAGVCTGLSSAIAFKVDASAGGFDIVTYYISSKKSTLVGKYNVVINGVIIASFTIIKAISSHNLPDAFGSVWFSFIYLLTVMLVIDVINVRNKKAQIQIITTNKDLPKLLLANIPHGATLVDAKGVYSDTEKFIIYMVVSTTEVKRAIKVIKQLDPESFVNVTSLQQVYGNFHMKPVK